MSNEQLEPLVHAVEHDDPKTQQQLFASLYDELHRVAERALRRNGFALTLGPTTLLHEAYLNLCERRSVLFPDRARFISYAACAMRGLILNYARSRRAIKRGGGFEITSLPADVAEQVADITELQRLSDAIDELAGVDRRMAEVVDLKYFVGLSFRDIAAMWNVSERTVQRDWEKARIFLHRSVSEHAEDTRDVDPGSAAAASDAD